MNQPDHSVHWLSPTRAWRLIECPVSVRPAAVPILQDSHETDVNTGTLAHRALEHWIRAEGYRTTDPKAALAEAADMCVAGLPTGPPSSWPVVRARLVARWTSLVELVGERSPDQVLSEFVLADADIGLRGQLDLLLLGDEIVVVDLKTQTLSKGKLPAWVEFQLTAYAHLIQKTYGRLPSRAEVFSLNRGRIEVPITNMHVASALETLALARSSNSAVANPDPETCFYCARRMTCEPHWDVAPDWPATDVVQGEIVRIESATSGVSAVCLATSSGHAWVSGVPANLVSSAGQRVRLVRLRQRSASTNNVPEWRWRRGSALAIL